VHIYAFIHTLVLNAGVGTDQSTLSVDSTMSIEPQQATASDIANLIAQFGGNMALHLGVSSHGELELDQAETTDSEPGPKENENIGINSESGLSGVAESSNVNGTASGLSLS
jgi:hypothetical protein